MSTRSPINPAMNLDCNNAGEACLENTQISGWSGTCPGTGQWTNESKIKAHAPLRQGAPAWVTVELDRHYSGLTVTAACDDAGNKSWSCHWETFERSQ